MNEVQYFNEQEAIEAGKFKEFADRVLLPVLKYKMQDKVKKLFYDEIDCPDDSGDFIIQYEDLRGVRLSYSLSVWDCLEYLMVHKSL